MKHADTWANLFARLVCTSFRAKELIAILWLYPLKLCISLTFTFAKHWGAFNAGILNNPRPLLWSYTRRPTTTRDYSKLEKRHVACGVLHIESGFRVHVLITPNPNHVSLLCPLGLKQWTFEIWMRKWSLHRKMNHFRQFCNLAKNHALFLSSS